jgi:hypothetical protein
MSTGPKLYQSKNSDLEIIQDVWGFVHSRPSKSFIRHLKLGSYRVFTSKEYNDFIEVWKSNFENNTSITIASSNLSKAYGDFKNQMTELKEFVEKYYHVLHNDRYLSLEETFEQYPAITEGSTLEKLMALQKERVENYENSFDSLIVTFKSLSGNKTKQGAKIFSIEVLEDESELKGITVYINTEYDIPKKFMRKQYWTALFNLAKEQSIAYDKAMFDYFNSNKQNPLYSKGDFTVTKILKEEDNYIKPNITIEIVTQKKVTQRTNRET